jgi:hypothetical protein
MCVCIYSVRERERERESILNYITNISEGISIMSQILLREYEICHSLVRDIKYVIN